MPARGGEGSNPMVNFHGEERSNETHYSTTDPDAMLTRKSRGTGAVLAYRGHLLTENRNGLVISTMTTRAYGTAERDAALHGRIPAGDTPCHFGRRQRV
jgi:hypothetical protein